MSSASVPLPRTSPRGSTRSVLRPGLRVLHREHDEIQIGLDPARAVRLRATPAVRRTLGAVAEGGPPEHCDPQVLLDLDRLGVLAQPDPAPSSPLAVRRFGPVMPAALLLALDRAGLGPPAEAAGPPREHEVVLLVGVGEPHRVLLDDLVADDTPHLLLRFSEGDAVLGPYVAPGVTACLRCVDAHHTERDARWPLLVEQQARLTATGRRDGVADPVDPLVAQLAVSWAARDLATTACRPSTWSTTIRLPRDLAGFEAVSWLRHPACGCSVDSPTPAVPGQRSQW